MSKSDIYTLKYLLRFQPSLLSMNLTLLLVQALLHIFSFVGIIQIRFW